MSEKAKSVGYKRLPPARVRGLKLVHADARLKKLRGLVSEAADQGVFIPTATPLPQGSFVEFDFRLDPEDPAYAVTGFVKSSNRGGDDPGMAVQFVRIERIEEDVLVDPERLWEKVTSIDGLPTLPAVVTRIMRLTVSETTSAADVAEVIAQDASLTAEVLRIVNSAYYTLRQPISTVERAIVVLGFNRIKSIALTTSVVDLWGRGTVHGAFDLAAFWEHSLGAAIACEVIARESDLTAPEDAFVAGLFHDLGKVVLDQYMGAVFAAVLDRLEPGGVLIHEAETEIMGFGHERIGEWLLTNWNIPDEIVAGAAHHHLPALAGDFQPVAHVVHLGDILCRALAVGSGGDDTIPEIQEATWKYLGLTAAVLDRMMGLTLVGIDNAQDFFRLVRA